MNAELNVELSASVGDTVGLQSSDGSQTATYTDNSEKTGLDVNVLNQLETQPTGLSKSIKNTVMTITETAQKVPTTALLDRNTMSIRVMGANTVYFGGSDITPSTGYPKFQYEEIIADVKDNPDVFIWAVCDSGKTCEVRILEIA